MTWPPPAVIAAETRRDNIPQTYSWIVLYALLATYLLVWLAETTPIETARKAVILSTISLYVLLGSIQLTQRYRPEPSGVKIWALCWGGLIATVISGWVMLGMGTGTRFVDVIFVAPIVEETCKIVGLLLLVHWRHIRNSLDGIVYAAIIAAGFAAIENLGYFPETLQKAGTTDMASWFMARHATTLFAHPLFTAVSGAMLGLAVTRHKNRGKYLIAGWGGAVALHALWNLSAWIGTTHDYRWVVALIYLGGLGIVGRLVHLEKLRIRNNIEHLPANIQQTLRTEIHQRRRQRQLLPANERGQYDTIIRNAYRIAAQPSVADKQLPAPEQQHQTEILHEREQIEEKHF